MSAYETAVWQDYGIDPLDLIGKAVRLTVIAEAGTERNGEIRATGAYYFGIVEAIDEQRGKTLLDPPHGNWARDALTDAIFDDVYPSVRVYFRGGMTVQFDPEKDAASFEWAEAHA